MERVSGARRQVTTSRLPAGGAIVALLASLVIAALCWADVLSLGDDEGANIGLGMAVMLGVPVGAVGAVSGVVTAWREPGRPRLRVTVATVAVAVVVAGGSFAVLWVTA